MITQLISLDNRRQDDQGGYNRNNGFDNQQNNRNPFENKPNNRGGYENQSNNRGSYDSQPNNRGSYDNQSNNRGSYDSQPNNRGSYDSQSNNRGGYDNQSNNRGSYDSQPNNRGGYDSQSNNRGGHDNQQNKRGGFESRQNDRGQNSRGRFDSHQNDRQNDIFNTRQNDRGNGYNNRPNGGFDNNRENSSNDNFDKTNDRESFDNRQNGRGGFSNRGRGGGGGNNFNNRDEQRGNYRQNEKNNFYNSPNDQETKSYSSDSKPEIIDWDKINERCEIAQKERWAKCPSLVKNFYVENEQVRLLTEDQVAQFREENNNIVVNRCFGEISESDPIPNPVLCFDHCFHEYPDLMGEIAKVGFKKPSPIQSQAWPVLMKGEDLIGIAQTGTGKTLAFLLPGMIHTELQPTPRGTRGGPNVLVMAPTRELALQIEKEVGKYHFRGMKA